MFERIGEGSSHFRHYDSSRGFNRHPAERTASQFVCMLGKTHLLGSLPKTLETLHGHEWVESSCVFPNDSSRVDMV